MTNYEKIKNMSVAEMVVFLDSFSNNCFDCCNDENHKNEDCPIYKEGKYCRPCDIKEWLNKEVSE